MTKHECKTKLWLIICCIRTDSYLIVIYKGKLGIFVSMVGGVGPVKKIDRDRGRGGGGFQRIDILGEGSQWKNDFGGKRKS